MRFVGYSMKWWWGIVLAVLGLFSWAVSFGWNGMPFPVKAIFVLLYIIAGLAIARQLFSTEPRLRVDEDGISCYQPFYATIAWEDIVSAERVPRVEKLFEHGEKVYRMSFCDAWRPVDIVVRDIDKYSRLIAPRFHRLLVRGIHPGGDLAVFKLRLDLTGMTGSSAEIIQTIDYYLEQKGRT